MAGMIARSVVGLGIGGAVLATAVMTAGCATSQELASMRQDIQKEVQDVRTKHEQSVSQSESKRKAAEELQVHIVKAFEAQAHTLASLATKVQDLQTRQDALQKERIAAQGTNAALRDTVLRSLKAEQSDLQQRLRKMTDYIKEIEQTDSVVAAPAFPLSSVPAVDRSDKSAAETHAPKGLDGSQLQK